MLLKKTTPITEGINLMLSHRFTALYAHAVVWIVVGLLLSYLYEWIWFVYLLPIVVIDMWFAVCL